jgi:TPR repeat protein
LPLNGALYVQEVMRSILIFLCLISFSTAAKESCGLNDIGLDNESSKVEELYYIGTCHYRNEDYEKAAANWSVLISNSETSDSDNELIIDANNNLGYLLFFGFGVKQNHYKALKHWSYAISLGHTESEFHLCHAYADKSQPTFSLKQAKMHCKKAQLIYQGLKEPDEDEKLMLKQIKSYLKGLE